MFKDTLRTATNIDDVANKQHSQSQQDAVAWVTLCMDLCE